MVHICCISHALGFPGGSLVENPALQMQEPPETCVRSLGSGRFLKRAVANPLQYSCSGNLWTKSLVGYSPVGLQSHRTQLHTEAPYLRPWRSDWSLYHTGQIKGHGGYLQTLAGQMSQRRETPVEEEELQPASSSSDLAFLPNI